MRKLILIWALSLILLSSLSVSAQTVSEDTSQMEFEKKIETEDLAIIYYEEGNNYFTQEKYFKAIEKYRKTTDLDPNFAEAWYNIAYVHALQNKKKEALENLKSAIELDPKYKEDAKKDEDLKNLWEDEEFKRLVE